jgi:hypothetical protein
MISIDALVLAASREVTDYHDDTHMNSALAGAAYKIGFHLTESQAREGLEMLRVVGHRASKMEKAPEEEALIDFLMPEVGALPTDRRLFLAEKNCQASA